MTITSVLNSIFIAFLFWIEGSGNLCCSSESEDVKIKNSAVYAHMYIEEQERDSKSYCDGKDFNKDQNDCAK